MQILEPIEFDDNTFISSVDINKGHKYLGMKFIPTDNFHKIITFNWKDRIGRICKFYAWLEHNENTPIEIKLLVLENCLFNHRLLKYPDRTSSKLGKNYLRLKIHFAIIIDPYLRFTYFFHQMRDNLVGYQKILMLTSKLATSASQ